MGCCRVGRNLHSMPYKLCGGESITLGVRRLQLCNLGSFLDSLLPVLSPVKGKHVCVTGPRGRVTGHATNLKVA